MNLTETTQTLAVLGPVFGVVSTILGIAVWVLKSHIQSKNETIKELKAQQQTLKAQLMQEEAKSHQLKIDVTELQKAKSYFEGHTASLEEHLC